MFNSQEWMRSLKRDKITHTEFILHEIDKEVDSTSEIITPTALLKED
jgi:hypothetical protein